MRKVRLLVVDDSATIRAVVEQIALCDPECDVVGVAPDVATARRLIEETRPNIVTLDLDMPGIGGLDFLEQLAGRAPFPIVVLSSSTRLHSDAARRVLELGAEACFDKNRVVADAAGFRDLLKQSVLRHGRRLARRAACQGAGGTRRDAG